MKEAIFIADAEGRLLDFNEEFYPVSPFYEPGRM